MTKCDETRHLYELTDAQSSALDALDAGASITDAADAAGKSRQTVSAWANHHPAFIAERNQRRKDRRTETASKVGHLDGLALAAIGEQLEAGDHDAAMAWIKIRGTAILADSADGPTEATKVVDDRARIDSESQGVQGLLNSMDVDKDWTTRDIAARLAEVDS